MAEPVRVPPPACTDPHDAALYWDHVHDLGILPDDARVVALRHVGACPACAARLVREAAAVFPPARRPVARG